ncbi:MAG: ergothioneine biosynthesis protein EgtB [Alphaproteobacteria bacterium]
MAYNLIANFKKVRNNTLRLISSLNPEDMVVQASDFVSPVKWHLAHTSWFFEKFILSKLKKYKPFNKSFDYIFNSYYNSIGNFNQKKDRGIVSRPSVTEVIEYREYVNTHIYEILEKKLDPEISNLLNLGINHEQQHQELIIMDIKYNFFKNPLKPEFLKKKKKKNIKYEKIDWNVEKKTTFEYGNKDNRFHYDNESPANTHEIFPFKLSVDFISNGQWKEFIESDGYKRPEFWLSDGWQYIKKKNITKPLYWLEDNFKFSLFGIEKINDNQPVSHISFYEANAYCRFKKKRLPTEFEYEYFLKNNPLKGNFLENKNFEEITINKKNQKENAYGNLWSWTSSYYLPYQGFKSFEGELSEYNQKFMCNQFVLKGGSFATPKDHVRSSYRNFYYPSDRWLFSGLRTVSNIS